MVTEPIASFCVAQPKSCIKLPSSLPSGCAAASEAVLRPLLMSVWSQETILASTCTLKNCADGGYNLCRLKTAEFSTRLLPRYHCYHGGARQDTLLLLRPIPLRYWRVQVTLLISLCRWMIFLVGTNQTVHYFCQARRRVHHCLGHGVMRTFTGGNAHAQYME